MKRVILSCALVLVAATAAFADVKLVVRSDGSKVIINDRRNSPGETLSQSTLLWLSRQRDRRSEYDPIIERYSSRYGVDPVLIRAVILVESNFEPGTISHKGARGLMQLMPGTAKRFKVGQIHDPEQNIRGGVAYLAFLLDLFPNDLPRVLASYNAGENAVVRHRGIPPYRETRQYVQKALTVYYGRPWGSGTIEVRPRRESPGTLQGGFDTRAPKLPPYVGTVATVGFQ